MRYANLLILMVLCAGPNRVLGQSTQVDLRTQSRDVDFAGAVSTRPLKSGTVIPGTCNAGEMFFKQDAPAGSNLYACTAANQWTVESGGIGLHDFEVTFTSSVLTIGGSCSMAAPCNVRFGNTVYTVTSSATATITAGTGTAFIYITGDGVLTVGHNLTVACSAGCLSLSGVASFPPDSIPVATWMASSGGWVNTGGVDVRAFQSTKAVIPQLGLTSVSVAGQTSLSIDTGLVGLKVSAPATVADACAPGSWATDGSYYYLCVALNTWRRAALTTF